MGKSNISYLDHVWNPITGCSGKDCQADCYARRFVKARPAMHGYNYPESGVRVPIPFNEVQFHPHRLNEPLKRKKPTVYGGGFFGDVSDEQVQIEWLAKIFVTVMQSPQHQFIFLTKQPQNIPKGQNFAETMPNAWWGTTVCTQADLWRVEELLKVPGKKWISIEPMLGPISSIPGITQCQLCGNTEWSIDGIDRYCNDCGEQFIMADLVVVGCESGPKRRPMRHEWAHDVVRQCEAAGVPVYVKQIEVHGKVSHKPEEWPAMLQVRDLPWRKA